MRLLRLVRHATNLNVGASIVVRSLRPKKIIVVMSQHTELTKLTRCYERGNFRYCSFSIMISGIWNIQLTVVILMDIPDSAQRSSTSFKQSKWDSTLSPHMQTLKIVNYHSVAFTKVSCRHSLTLCIIDRYIGTNLVLSNF